MAKTNNDLKNVRVDKNNVLVQGKEPITVVNKHTASLVKSVQKEKTSYTALAWANGVATVLCMAAGVITAVEGSKHGANTTAQNMKAIEATFDLLFAFLNGLFFVHDNNQIIKYKKILKREYESILESCEANSDEEMGK